MLKLTKKFLSFSFAVFLSLGFSLNTFAYTETVTEKSDVPQKIVFLGDSIAAGMGLEGYSRDDLYNCRSYANILGEEYKKELNGKCETTMINKAVSGEASYDLLDHLEKGEFDSSLKDSDAVVISIGANDMIKVFIRDIVNDVGYDVTKGTKSIKTDAVTMLKVVKDAVAASGKIDDALENCSKNLNTIVDNIKSKTDGVIIIQTVYNPMDYLDKYKVIKDYTNEKLSKLNEIIRNNSENNSNYIVCDVAGQFKDKSLELTNISKMDIHPNPKGHELIAKTVDETIRTQTYTYEKTIEIPDSSVDMKNTENTNKQAGLIPVICSAVLFGIIILAFVIRKVFVKNHKKSTSDN